MNRLHLLTTDDGYALMDTQSGVILAHDVSGEKRDEGGKWTIGSKVAKLRTHIDQFHEMHRNRAEPITVSAKATEIIKQLSSLSVAEVQAIGDHVYSEPGLLKRKSKKEAIVILADYFTTAAVSNRQTQWDRK